MKIKKSMKMTRKLSESTIMEALNYTALQCIKGTVGETGGIPP